MDHWFFPLGVWPLMIALAGYMTYTVPGWTKRREMMKQGKAEIREMTTPKVSETEPPK